MWLYVAGRATGDHILKGRVRVDICSDCSGSIYGGQLLTITGTGFVVEDTTVDIDNQKCVIEDISVTEVGYRAFIKGLLANT